MRVSPICISNETKHHMCELCDVARVSRYISVSKFPLSLADATTIECHTGHASPVLGHLTSDIC